MSNALIKIQKKAQVTGYARAQKAERHVSKAQAFCA